MKQIIKKEINSESNNILPVGRVKQENNITLELELIKDGKPLLLTDQQILIGGKTSKGKILEQKDGISKSDNKLTVNLKNEFVLDEGILEIDINLKDSDGQMTTSSFFLEVISKTLNKEAIEATDYITSLDLIINNFKTITANEIENFNKNSKKSIDDFNVISKTQLDNQTKDYESLKRIIIDENQAAELQAQVTKNREDIDILNDEQPMWSKKEGIGQVTIDNTFTGVAKSSIVYGKTTGGYNPATGQFDSIISSGEQEGNKIVVKSVGKNLKALNISANIEIVSDGYKLKCIELLSNKEDIFNNKGQYRLNQQYALSYYGKLSGDVNNGFRLAIFYTDGTNSKASVTSENFEKIILTSSPNKTVDYITGYYSSGNGNFVIKNVQLEEGTIASKYEEYIEYKKEILLTGIEGGHKGLTRIQNEYYGESGKYVEKLSSAVFNGTQRVSDLTELESTVRFKLALDGADPSPGNSDAISDRLEYVPNYSLDKEHFYQATDCIYVFINKSKLISVDVTGVNDYFTKNPMKIIYTLATPVVHNIEKTRINTYNGTTHFIQENEIKGNMSFEVAVDRDARIEVNDINIKNNKTEIDICNKAIDINRIDIIKQELITEELNEKSIVFDSEIKSIKQENVNQQTQINRKLETVDWDIINNKPISFNPTSLNTELLWEGASYVASDHTITPSKPLSNCRTGWMLVFSKYTASTVRDYSFSVVYIRKDTKLTMEDRGVGFLMSSTGENITKFEDIINKYMYINNTSIRGTAGNVTGQNSFSVLRYVYEF